MLGFVNWSFFHSTSFEVTEWCFIYPKATAAFFLQDFLCIMQYLTQVSVFFCSLIVATLSLSGDSQHRWDECWDIGCSVYV